MRRLETCGGGRGRHSGVRHLLNIPESLKDQHPPQLRPIVPTYTESYMHAHSRINPPGAPMVFSALQETDRDLRLKPPDHRNVRSTDLALCYARSEEVTTRSRRNEWLARASRLCQIYLLSDKMDIVTSDPLSIIIRRCGP